MLCPLVTTRWGELRSGYYSKGTDLGRPAVGSRVGPSSPAGKGPECRGTETWIRHPLGVYAMGWNKREVAASERRHTGP